MIKSLSKVDDMTFNQSVAGSNPAGLTTRNVTEKINKEINNKYLNIFYTFLFSMNSP